MKFVLAIAIALVFATVARADYWAFLTAGSNDFWNYRHQTDICHAYNLLIDGGLNPDHIIVMSYDDVPFASQNPYYGQLFPKKGNNIPDVRNRCKIDYRGATVTPKNWMNVVKGDFKAMKGIGTGRVINSTKDDLVMLYFEDHGGEGLICFPNEDLYVDDYQKTLTYLEKNNRYNKLVFYLSACESGSMWEGFFAKNMFASTSANPHQSAYAVYCPPNDDLVNGKHIGACLGSEYSVRWEEDAEANDTSKEDLMEQFLRIKGNTKQSEVCKWSDDNFTHNYTASQFIGNKPKKGEFSNEALKNKCEQRDAKLLYLVGQMQNTPNRAMHIALDKELAYRKFVDDAFSHLSQKFQVEVSQPMSMDGLDHQCFKDSMKAWSNKCGRLSEYGLKLTRFFRRFCTKTQNSLESLMTEIDILC